MNREDGKPLSKSALKKLAKEREKAERAAKRLAEEAVAKAEREAANVDHATANYGTLPMVQSTQRTGEKRAKIGELSVQDAGKEVLFRARMQNARAQGAKMCFMELRQQMHSIQALVVANAEGSISKQMVKWAAGINVESIVLVRGVVAKVSEPVKSASITDIEIHVKQVHIIGEAEPQLPIQFSDASRPDLKEGEEENAAAPTVKLATKLDNRFIDLRTAANQSIFRISSGVCTLFKEFLLSKGFIETHTPKLIAAASEGGANVFKVTYFKQDAYLAQSPQLYKQMLIAGDMERVFEIAPVFRAENSQTHRHMTEV